MGAALAEARKALVVGEVPVGAIVVIGLARALTPGRRAL